MRNIGWLAALAMVGTGVPVTIGWTAPTIEPSVWVATATPDRAARETGELPFDDHLSFERGQVSSRIGGKRGFPAGTYTLSQIRPGTLSLTIQQQSSRHGEMTWSLDIVGAALQGLLIWTTPEGEHHTFQVLGHRESGEAPAQ